MKQDDQNILLTIIGHGGLLCCGSVSPRQLRHDCSSPLPAAVSAPQTTRIAPTSGLRLRHSTIPDHHRRMQFHRGQAGQPGKIAALVQAWKKLRLET